MDDLTLVSPELIEDPYPLYARMRREDPIRWSEQHHYWLVTRYQDALALVKDTEHFSCNEIERREVWRKMAEDPARSSGLCPIAEMRLDWMLTSDPPKHTRLRGLVSQAVNKKVAERLRPDIENIVATLLDTQKGASQFDVVSTLAYPLPVKVICHILGVPDKDHEKIATWSKTSGVLLEGLGQSKLADANHVCSEAAAYFSDLVEERRHNLQNDLISELIRAGTDEGRLSQSELIASIVLLFVAGHETTVNLISNGVYALLREPAKRDQLARDLDLIPFAVDEFLRYESPVKATARYPKADFEFGGKVLKKDDLVIVSLAAANRDPEQFSQPDELVLGRHPNRHLAFAHGIHYCVGAALAKMEAEVAVRQLLDRWPKLELASERPMWVRSSVFRKLRELPVRVAAAR
jgi:pimeloyl-[acyl-carrier protein] synthase